MATWLVVSSYIFNRLSAFVAAEVHTMQEIDFEAIWSLSIEAVYIRATYGAGLD